MRKKDNKLTLRLSAEDKRFLQRQAKKNKMSVSRLVREVISQTNNVIQE